MLNRMIEDVSTAAGAIQRKNADSSARVPALTILSHATAHRAGERLLLDSLAAGREVALSRNAPDFLRPGSAIGSPLGDPFISRKPIRFVGTLDGGVRCIIGDSSTIVALDEPIRGAVEFSPADIDAGVVFALADRVVLLLHFVEGVETDAADAMGMVGRSAGVRRARQHIERVVDLDVPVLVRGETGTGKELVARALHERGPRRGRRFVSVNLGAIPKELAAAELFGAQKGAYSGAARDREGYFRAAHGGTLFLDEVGEASSEVQVMLLRVLETAEMYPVGSDAAVKTNVRLVAATDANLEAHIRDGRFKAPLLHRLAGYEIRLPPLRERRDDLGLLFYHFAREELDALGAAKNLAPDDPFAPPWLPAALATRLFRFHWPGNIRQLRNVVRQLVLGSRGKAQAEMDPRLLEEFDAVPTAMPADRPSVPKDAAKEVSPRRKSTEVTDEELAAALRESSWDLKAAANRLGIPRSSMYDLIDKSPSIRKAGDLSAVDIEQCFRVCQGDLDAMVEKLQVSKRGLQRRLREMGLVSGK